MSKNKNGIFFNFIKTLQTQVTTQIKNEKESIRSATVNDGMAWSSTVPPCSGSLKATVYQRQCTSAFQPFGQAKLVVPSEYTDAATPPDGRNEGPAGASTRPYAVPDPAFTGSYPSDVLFCASYSAVWSAEGGAHVLTGAYVSSVVLSKDSLATCWLAWGDGWGCSVRLAVYLRSSRSLAFLFWRRHRKSIPTAAPMKTTATTTTITTTVPPAPSSSGVGVVFVPGAWFLGLPDDVMSGRCVAEELALDWCLCGLPPTDWQSSSRICRRSPSRIVRETPGPACSRTIDSSSALAIEQGGALHSSSR